MSSSTNRTSVPYNYAHFRPSYYDLASFDGPAVGDAFPDIAALTIDGDTIEWSGLRGTRVVIETASATCPMYVKGVPAMRSLAERHPETKFLVLYVREAHPGESLRPHETIEQKLDAARLLRSRHGDERYVLVDDLQGTVHRALGGLPNMVYVVGPDGTVEFRGDWTETEAVAAVLDGSASPAALRRQHFPPAKPSPRIAVRALLTGGLAALADFAVGVPSLIRLHRRADRSYEDTPTQPTEQGEQAMDHYQDRSLLIDDDGITITSYFWPGHRRTIPFRSIRAVEAISLGAFSGRYRLVGFEFRRLRHFFPWDRRRRSTSRAIALDIGKRVRPVISPEDHDRVLTLIADRLDTQPADVREETGTTGGGAS